jgi:uncharacterized protein
VCFKGYPNIAQVLIASGANPDARNNGGATPLMMAAMFGQVEIARLLIERGADLQALDATGKSVATYAQMSGHPEIGALVSRGQEG